MRRLHVGKNFHENAGANDEGKERARVPSDASNACNWLGARLEAQAKFKAVCISSSPRPPLSHFSVESASQNAATLLPVCAQGTRDRGVDRETNLLLANKLNAHETSG